MVVGKLLILLSGSVAYAETFTYSAGKFTNYLSPPSYGIFKQLNVDQRLAYNQAVLHAVHSAENGQTVTWYRQNASGRATPVHTWPTGNGHCRRIYIETIAFNQKRVQTPTVCYRIHSDRWTWISDK